MIVPFIVSISREVLLAVPQDQREGALALGATQWETTWQVVVPFAEAGNLSARSSWRWRARWARRWPSRWSSATTPRSHASLFAPGYSIAAVIANEFTEATERPLHPRARSNLGLVLFALTIVINGLARLLIHATSRHSAQPA